MKVIFDHLLNRLFAKELIREDLAEFVSTPTFENRIRSQKGNEGISNSDVRAIQCGLIDPADIKYLTRN